MQIQTVFKAGNSSAVVIPREFLDQGFKPGLQVVVNSFNNGESLLISKINKTKSNKSKVSTEFKKWLDNALEEDSEILDGLA